MSVANSSDKSFDSRSNNAAEVECVRSMLLSRVPYELADIILTEAEYWTKMSSRRELYLKVEAADDPLNNAKWCYMVSDPIPTVQHGERIVPTKIKSVQFSLRSCDQGWGGCPNSKNMYHNSCTWFEASIIRPLPDQQQTSGQPDEFSQGPIEINRLTYSGYDEIRSPYKYKCRWLLQMNAQASRHIREHKVVWTAGRQAMIKQDDTSIVEFNPAVGHGRGFGFVEALQTGDRIAIIARALYPGWENHVYSAEIEVSYQA